MDELSALRLQLEWGADEALGDEPVDRTASAPAHPAPTRRPVPAIVAPANDPVVAGDLQALHAALDALQSHPLRATASHTVMPSGNAAARLLVLADAPGPEDDRSGQAFHGGAGAVLDRVMGSAGLTREVMLLGHLVPWRPPGGRPPTREEVSLCLPYLHRMLQVVRPAVLVLAGAGLARALLPEAPGRRPRGRWVEAAIPDLGAVPALVVPHPDQWLTDGRSKQAIWSDLVQVRIKLDGVADPISP